MSEVDRLKTIIFLVASIASFLILSSKRDLFVEEFSLYFVTLIRIILIINSIRSQWPLLMCTTINVPITVFVLVLD